MNVNIARMVARSAANGPGERFVIWVQGCSLACKGCWNPDTWSFRARDLRSVESIAGEILATEGIEGLTLTGGEPFLQAKALGELARVVRNHGLSIFIFTGFEMDELLHPYQLELLKYADVVVTGRYVESARIPWIEWRGSANQRVHYLTPRYSVESSDNVGEIEYIISGDGRVAVTGFPVAGRLDAQCFVVEQGRPEAPG
jgi:anaerobic ribonucleoside-triphosphate reductase activating protein